MMFGGIVPASIVVSSSTSAAGGFDPLVSVGLGVGGIFVAVALVYLFAYLDLLNATPTDDTGKQRLKSMLIAVSLPLLITFGAIVLYRGLLAIGVQ